VKAFGAGELPHRVSARVVLAASGPPHAGDGAARLRAGMSALAGPGRTRWFENDSAAGLSSAQAWPPPSAGTVWTVAGDRCTWLPPG
jgi:hypothetical protein